MLTVIEDESKDGRKFSNVETVSKVMKGTEIPKEIENPKQILILSPGEFSREIFDSLSDNLKAQITRTPEYQEIQTGKPASKPAGNAGKDFDDEIPF
jgi:hypothetical protein